MSTTDTRKLLIQQGIFDYNMNTTAAGMDESKAMDEAVAYFEALMAAQKQRWEAEAQINILAHVLVHKATGKKRIGLDRNGVVAVLAELQRKRAAALDGVIGEKE